MKTHPWAMIFHPGLIRAGGMTTVRGVVWIWGGLWICGFVEGWSDEAGVV
jgi:hypothetical protein